jgi:hypothetical protein
MREFLVSIQVVTGLMAGLFFAASLKVVGDGGMFKPLLSHVPADSWLGIALALFVASYFLWRATSNE